MADMVSELNTGHAYIVPPPMPIAHPQNMGFLGIDVAPVPESGAVKITKIYHGDAWSPDLSSPLAEPGIDVKEGDYILEIAGEPVAPNQDIQALLLGTRGETVAVMVNDKPTKDGARVVRVRPLLSESAVRYEDWVESRVKYVQEHGGPNFGYLHIPDMENGGLTDFVKGQIPDVYKTAMIYDERYNGGGYTSSLILQDIASKPLAWFKPRVGNPWTREGWANIGHKAMLCNEDNFSDGELFVESWKRLKLGPVVGMRTGGGEVGSGGGYRLIDGGSIYVPNYGAYMDGEWLVEGHGATPTVEIDQDPNEQMAGKDPQLDKAIEILKAELQKDPISIPTHPPFKLVPPTQAH
jgi:tricorn protease